VASLLLLTIYAVIGTIIISIIKALIYRLFQLATLPIRCLYAILRLLITISILIPLDVYRHLLREWKGILILSISIVLYMSYHSRDMKSPITTTPTLMEEVRATWTFVMMAWKYESVKTALAIGCAGCRIYGQAETAFGRR
jgi:hypothetical protein